MSNTNNPSAFIGVQRVVILIVLSILTGGMSRPGLSQDARTLFMEACESRKWGDYKGALKILNKIIEKDSLQDEYLIERGRVHFGLNQDRKALKDFNDAARINPGNFDAYLARCEYFINKNSMNNAFYDANMAYYTAITNLEKSRARVLRARVFRKEGHPEIAVLELEKGLDVDSTNIEGLKELADLYHEKGLIDKAMEYLHQAIRHDPFDPVLFTNVGYLLSQKGDHSASIHYYNKALDFDPDEPVTLSNRGFAFFKLEQHSNALNDLDKSVKNDAFNSVAFFRKALVHLAVNEKRRSCKCLKKAIKLGGTEQLVAEANFLLEEYCN